MNKLDEFLNENQYNKLGSIIYEMDKENPIYIGKKINIGHLKWLGDIQKKLQEIYNDLFLIRKEIKER